MLRGLRPGAHNCMNIIYPTLDFLRGRSGIRKRVTTRPNSTGLCLEYRFLVLIERVLNNG